MNKNKGGAKRLSLDEDYEGYKDIWSSLDDILTEEDQDIYYVEEEI